MERRRRRGERELTPLQKVRQKIIDYGEKAPLGSKQWQAFEDNINLAEAVCIAVVLGGEKGSTLVNGIGSVIDMRSENPEYLTAYQEVDAMLTSFTELNINRLRRQFGTFPHARNPRFSSAHVSTKELTDIRDRIIAKKTQQPPTPPRQ